mgnify:FL=1
MKKYNYILLGMLSLFFVTTLTSCSDYFDQVPDDRLSLEGYPHQGKAAAQGLGL